MELGLKGRDKTYLNKLENFIKFKENMMRVLELAVIEVFEEGVKA